jgi:hypothetical protein
LRLDLISLTIGIALVSIATSAAVVLIRRANRAPSAGEDLATMIRLTLVVALGLIGIVFLFQGMFE